jgi:hypothetical protein
MNGLSLDVTQHDPFLCECPLNQKTWHVLIIIKPKHFARMASRLLSRWVWEKESHGKGVIKARSEA